MFTFEIFTLYKDTLCHEKEIFTSITPFRDYDDMKRIAIAKGIELSKEYPTEIIEVNLWDFETEEWIEEFSYLNGKSYFYCRECDMEFNENTALDEDGRG